MHRGYTKSWRKKVDNPLFKKPLIWHLFDYYVSQANHKKNSFEFNCREVTVERGCLVTGRKKASDDTGLTEREVRTAITALVNFKMIEKVTSKSTNKYTYIKIINYDSYQSNEDIGDQQNDLDTTKTRPRHDQDTTTNKNEQKLIITKKNDKKKDIYTQAIKNIIDYLNSKTGQNLTYDSQVVLKEIPARLKKGYKEQDFIIVIDKKCREWLGTKQQVYLRPSTLFRECNFDQYLNALEPVNQQERKSTVGEQNIEFLKNHYKAEQCKSNQSLIK